MSFKQSLSTSDAASHSAQQRLRDKQREYTAFLFMLQQATLMKENFNSFNDRLDTLADGADAVAGVVEHWQNAFRATQLALSTLENKKVPTSATDPTLVLPPGAMPDRLVRIPINSANQRTSN